MPFPVALSTDLWKENNTELTLNTGVGEKKQLYQNENNKRPVITPLT